MLKSLFIIPYIPYPLDSGGNQAFFHMIDFLRTQMSVSILLHSKSQQDQEHIKELQKLWEDVTFFTFTPLPQNNVAIESKPSLYEKLLIKIKCSIERKIRRKANKSTQQQYLTADFVRQKSTLQDSLYNKLDKDYVEYVSNITHAQHFDIIQVEFFELISLGYILPKEAETIFVHHELRYVRNANEMKLFQNTTQEDIIFYQIAKNFETDALRQYKHIITLTEIDRQKLTELLGNKSSIYASPAAIKKEWNFPQFVPCTNNRFTFVGSEDHFPNLDAVIWFCQKIAPILRQHKFEFTFQVIGKWKGKYLTELSQICPEIKFVGYIKQLDEFLSGSIAVIPIRIGSGMRMKILEAIAASVPFITTAKGVEGIDFHHMNECLIADTPEEFAHALMHTITDPKMQQQLVENSQRRFIQLYDSTRMFNLRLSIYKEICRKTSN